VLQNTICFLIKKDPTSGKISEILLARKKTGFGQGKIVGIGGNLEPGETVQQACVREFVEETAVGLEEKDLQRAAKITFIFPAKPEWDRVVYVYFSERWHGTLQSSREVDPFWTPIDQIPVDEMWADSPIWLAEILKGRKIVARFTFNPDNESLADYFIKDDKDFLWPHLKSLPYFRSLLRSVEASYYQDIDFPEPVLDLGSGDGHFASVAFDFRINVGLDPWWGPLKESQRYPASYEGLVQADGAEMPFPDAYFASGLSNSVLEHIPHLDEVLKETARVLKPGAKFVFCCPNPGYYEELAFPAFLRKIGLKRPAKWYTDWFNWMSRTVHADSPEVWEARLEKAGFTLERWWHYFPKESLHVLEWGHYFGAPTLLPKLLFDRWILSPTRWNLALTEKLVRPYAGTEPHPQGTYTFFIARRK